MNPKFRIIDKSTGNKSEYKTIDWLTGTDENDIEFPDTDESLPLKDFLFFKQDYLIEWLPEAAAPVQEGGVATPVSAEEILDKYDSSTGEVWRSAALKAMEEYASQFTAPAPAVPGKDFALWLEENTEVIKEEKITLYRYCDKNNEWGNYILDDIYTEYLEGVEAPAPAQADGKENEPDSLSDEGQGDIFAHLRINQIVEQITDGRMHPYSAKIELFKVFKKLAAATPCSTEGKLYVEVPASTPPDENDIYFAIEEGGYKNTRVFWSGKWNEVESERSVASWLKPIPPTQGAATEENIKQK